MARPPHIEALARSLAARLPSNAPGGPGKLSWDGPRLGRVKLLAEAAWMAARGQVRTEWMGSPPHRWLIGLSPPRTVAAAPRDRRAADPRQGQDILEGLFVFDGLPLETGAGGDPWNRAAPSRDFARELHGLGWLAGLIAVPGGARCALSLTLGWQAVFGVWNGFSWSLPILERRVFNLACNLGPLLAEATPAEAASLLASLAQQARHLLIGDGQPERAAEQACAAAVAGCALGGKAGERLRARALAKLARVLPVSVLPDGGHASRSPEAALELLLDLRTLDGALADLGQPAPPEAARAIDRLAGAVRFFTLADGRLPALQGGEPSAASRIAAALAGLSVPPPPSPSAPHSGYEILAGRRLQILVDAGAPARGAWSQTACAQPFAMEVLAGKHRLITSSAWSPRASGAQALRLTPAASTASISDTSCGRPMQGRLARILGRRLEGAPIAARLRRQDSEAAAWVDLGHDGWAPAFGLTHERRLYLDLKTDELRGEDQLLPLGAIPPRGKRPVFLTVRFQLHPDVKASLALDHKSVLLQPKTGGGWWLRNDAPEVSIEPGVHLDGGRPHHASQVVMRLLLNREGQARIRWKLAAA
jgi:uncharacterized heparinase superfamily protein